MVHYTIFKSKRNCYPPLPEKKYMDRDLVLFGRD